MKYDPAWVEAMKSHVKGGSFERKIAGDLSDWLTFGASNRVLWRNPNSGAMAHRLSSEQSHWVGGDIGVLDRDCAQAVEYVRLFHTELKHWRCLEWHRFIQHEGMLWQTWVKTKVLAEQEGRLPLVIARQNRQPDMLLMRAELSQALAMFPEVITFWNKVAVCSFADLLRTDPITVLNLSRGALLHVSQLIRDQTATAVHVEGEPAATRLEGPAGGADVPRSSQRLRLKRRIPT
ncbi:MAG: putative PDDEXK endonuclease [Bryobacteraceae bacterium]